MLTQLEMCDILTLEIIKGQTCRNARTQSWESKVAKHYDSSVAIDEVYCFFYCFACVRNVNVLVRLCNGIFSRLESHIIACQMLNRLMLDSNKTKYA